MPEAREGTCPWCEREGQQLRWILWYSDGIMIRDWACERCRRICMTPTVNENED